MTKKNLFLLYVSYILKLKKPLNKPLRIWIETTNHCNLSCHYCPNKNIPNTEKGYMKINIFKKILNEILEFKPDLVFHIGGEPLLNKQIFEMIQLANKAGLTTILNTNAVLLNEKKITKLLDNIPNQIEFSIDTFNKEEYEKDRKYAKLDQTLDNIHKFLETREKYKITNNTVKIRLNEYYPLCKELPEKLKNFYKYKKVSIYSHPIHNWGGKIKLSNYKKRIKYMPCLHIWLGIGIKWDGKAVPCCRDFLSEYILGDIKKNSILDLWKNKRFAEIRSILSMGDNKKISLCKECDVLYDKSLLGIPLMPIRVLFKTKFQKLYK